MEDIKLPLKRGTLNDLEASQPTNSQDGMEVDSSSQVGQPSHLSNSNKARFLYYFNR